MDAVAALERNTHRFLRELGLAGGGVERDDPEVGWVLGGSPIDYDNAVYRARLTEGTADRAIAESIAELDRLGVAGTWHVGPWSTPADLPERLLAAGFADDGAEPGMARLLIDLPDAPPPAGTRFAEVADADGLRTWAAILADGFGEGPREAEWAAEVYGVLGVGPRSRHRLVTAHLDGEPAAAAALLLDGGVAGIYFVGTRPRFRGRGLGAAITAHAMALAAEAGAGTAVLGASPMGRPVFERLGFTTVATIRVFARPATTAAAPS
jgi:ribosomal protein S18 acetylase RimI-like enzyme